MKKTEQQLADELEQAITAVMQGEITPPADDAQTNETRLAADLVHLSARTNPNPAFVAQLRWRLSARALQLKKSIQPPERPSFWRDLQEMLKEGFTMKRTVALGALITLIVFIGIYGLWRGLPGGSDEPQIAQVTPTPAETLPTDNTEPVESGQPLAQLPRFDAPALGMGGGGGDASGEETMAMPMPVEGEFDMKMMDPFSGTTFILNGTLPLEPTSGLVHQRFPEAGVDAALVRQIANQYGFTGPLYTESYTSDVPVDGPGAPSTVYIAFDGRRTLRVDSWAINYVDEAASEKLDYTNPTPAANAVATAEAFLAQRGQLDFPYEAESLSWDSVLFYRLVDGLKVNEPEISVTVNQDGEIVYVFDNSTIDWNMLGNYPLISAEQAWQKVMAGVFENNIQYHMMPADLGQPMPFEEPAYLADYQYWPRMFAAGSEIHLYEWPVVYRPVDGGAPLVKIRAFNVIADEATLNALADGRDGQMHVWGTLNEDRSQLQLAGWEAMGEYNPIFQRGVVQRQNGELLFSGLEGENYILLDAPADVPDGLEVNIFGYSTRDIGLEYPVLDWESIEKYIEYPEPELLPERYPADGDVNILPVDPFVPFRYEQVQINEATLVYYVTYSYPEMPEGQEFVVGPMFPTIFLQPAWAFSGTADNGDQIRLFVQAVAEEHLQP